MRSTSLRRLLALTWTTTAVLVLAVIAATLALIDASRNEALRNADNLVSRLVVAAETDINRNLMSVDLILAGLQGELSPALSAGRFDAEAAHQILAALQDRQLMFADLPRVVAHGNTLTAALSASRRAVVAAPPELLARVRSPGALVMQVSAPLIGRASGERSLLLARALDLPGAPPMIALAEVPSSLLLSVASSGEGTSGAVLTLERDDGLVLVSQPPDDHLTGRRLDRPLEAGQSTGDSRGVPGRFEAWRVRQASRPTLYPHLLIAATLSEPRALAAWVAQRGSIATVAAAFMALILGVAILAHRQVKGLARARKQAADSAALLDQALESMGDAFLLCDADDKVIRWNDRYLELFPWLKPVLRAGVPFRLLAQTAGAYEMGHGADPEKVRTWVESRMAARRQISDEFVQPLQGGTAVSTVERRTPDGGMVSVYRDMSQKEARLSRAMKAAEAASEAKSQFLANMSHEIRTPLNAVLGLNGLLLKSSLDAQQRQHAELVQSSGQLLLSLISDILDLTRIDAGRIELQAIPFDPRAVVGEVVSLLQTRAQAQGLQLRRDIDAKVPAVLVADAVRLRQVLLNLIGNALKFTDQGGVEVRVRCESTGPELRLVIEVEDTGIGIAAEVLPQLFDRFTQGDATSARRHGGSGLGLAITREIVKRMGGSISVRSSLGQGSCFTATLRCEPGEGAPAEAEASKGSWRASSWSTLPTGGSMSILVAEDNEVNQLLIESLLKLLGHQPSTVANGRQALERAAAGGWDAILMDMQMPELDGLAATQAIRRLSPPLNEVPIIAMTANARAEDRAACFAAGMDDFLSKPVDVKALQAALARAAQARVPLA